jgi:hypothetical protein
MMQRINTIKRLHPKMNIQGPHMEVSERGREGGREGGEQKDGRVWGCGLGLLDGPFGVMIMKGEGV